MEYQRHDEARIAARVVGRRLVIDNLAVRPPGDIGLSYGQHHVGKNSVWSTLDRKGVE